MRRAFVLRLGPETKPSSGLFEGWVEEVDSGKELRFHTVDELLAFLGQRFDEVPRTSDSVSKSAAATEE